MEAAFERLASFRFPLVISLVNFRSPPRHNCVGGFGMPSLPVRMVINIKIVVVVYIKARTLLSSFFLILPFNWCCENGKKRKQRMRCKWKWAEEALNGSCTVRFLWFIAHFLPLPSQQVSRLMRERSKLVDLLDSPPFGYLRGIDLRHATTLLLRGVEIFPLFRLSQQTPTVGWWKAAESSIEGWRTVKDKKEPAYSIVLVTQLLSSNGFSN